MKLTARRVKGQRPGRTKFWTSEEDMQKQPVTDEQCAVVREVVEKVLGALREDDGRYDAGDRIVVNLSKKDVGRLRGALKSL